jgi:hypothetical protein
MERQNKGMLQIIWAFTARAAAADTDFCEWDSGTNFAAHRGNIFVGRWQWR